MSSNSRFALYLTPDPNRIFYKKMSALLGYDAGTAAYSHNPFSALTNAQWDSFTQTPRLYGFHATLIAPFYLKDAAGLDDLHTLCTQCSQQFAPFVIDGYRLQAMDAQFLYLQAKGADAYAQQLHQWLLEESLPLLRPLSPVDLQRRGKHLHHPQQQAYLNHYGYPYVHEFFRLHFTLSSSISAANLSAFQSLIRQQYGDDYHQESAITHLSLFQQEAPNTAFTIFKSYAFKGGNR